MDALGVFFPSDFDTLLAGPAIESGTPAVSEEPDPLPHPGMTRAATIAMATKRIETLH